MDSMIETSALTVHVSSIPNGSLFLWGTRENGGIWDALDLKNMLFAWHRASFYGTFMEPSEWQNREGIELLPLEALDYFGDPQPVQHLQLSWDTECTGLIRLAPAIKEALATGRFMPDYEKWKSGEIGWKLQLPEELQALETPSVSRWIHALIPEWVDADGVMKDNLRKLEAAYPLMRRGELGADVWLDEEDWLVAIGWSQDRTPMRSCLQLVEPDPAQGHGWQLRIVLQDRLSPDVLRTVTPDGVPVPGELPLPEAWQPELGRVQRDAAKWVRILPWLDAAEGSLRQTLTEEEAWRFLAEGSVRLVEAGTSVFLPAWWDRIRKLRPKLRAKIKSSVGSGRETMFGLSQLMQFDWKLAVGDIELTEEEFRQLLEEKRKLIQIRGNWIQLDPQFMAQVEQIMKQVAKKKGLSFRDVLELHFAGDAAGLLPAEDDPDALRYLDMEVELNEQLRHMIDQLTLAESIPIVQPPASFHGSLRHYQVDGISWLLFLRRFGLGGCLADDMGLGKTIQWITYLLTVKEQEQPDTPSLLICPTSVLGNWQMELKRFAPSLKVHLHYGPQRLKGPAFKENVGSADLVLTSYTLSHLDEAELSSVAWNSICLDEAQNIKNAYTKQASAIRRLDGYHRIALTGTPIENRLTELWSIFDFANPGYLGTIREFTHRYVNAIEKTQDNEIIGKVQKLIRPFLLRRVKKDPAIQLDLPEKNESKTFISLTAEQGSLYENYIQDMFERLDKLSAMERRGLILAALTKLKQVCNHPALLLKEGLNAPWSGRSNKLERLLEMVQELRQEGDKCLIFTQFVETGNLLKHVLQQELGEPVLFLHGSTSKTARDEMIAHFQDVSQPVEEQRSVFILSLKAGGIGLNLTAANHVFHYDRWWNPAVENQATDRAFRIGQTRHVQVHKFVTLGTLEERIDEMIERKLGLSQQIVGTGENWITELSTDELRDLFSLRREWVEA
ncbi:DEAD/DEAH box helicase [Paenibacillus sedimenti]|uniref:DEAD/DEAH box helicase n=1 Tax=Paenibacillus sedimenti TaxID=2770274 RepID=A0A926KTQ9_9BACL|nr:DEAD/DEAH box helicase [Paenibacillus sedimenti]MBD0381989.1 DEAD/DEAH box helicase [Paenibacillus sedimenti]